MKNIAMWCVLTFPLVATWAQAEEATLAVEVTGSDELVREKGRFEDTSVHPDADFTRYRKLHLWIAELQFREVAAQRDHTVGRIDNGSAFALSNEEQERYREVVSNAFVDELGRSKNLELVADFGPSTLIVRASILDIVCHVPPPSAGDVNVYPSTVGEGTLRFELIDSETGVMQARVEERRKIQPPGRIIPDVSSVPIYRETMWRDVRRWSSEAASDLRRALGRAQSGRGLK